MADRIYVAEKNRDFINEHLNILGFDVAQKKEILFMTMALGMDEPQPLPTKRTGWILYKTFNTNDQALIGALRLGADDVDDENINQFADFDTCISYAEQCSQSGFEKLAKMVQEANNNNDELEAVLMAELDRLYRKNVEIAE